MKKNKKTDKSKYLTSKNNERPQRDNKYFFRNKWVFSFVAVVVILFLSVYGFDGKKNGAEEMVPAVVEKVTDGDTIVVSVRGVSQSIRMIGIDAPESVSPNEEENTVYGKEASYYTEQRLKAGTTVYLTFDEERYDQYSRLLAYIWMCEDHSDINDMFQYQMVKDGYAQAIKYEPNTKYYVFLFSAMEMAREEQNGLWGAEGIYKSCY